jgi:hypothetical protein
MKIRGWVHPPFRQWDQSQLLGRRALGNVLYGGRPSEMGGRGGVIGSGKQKESIMAGCDPAMLMRLAE